MKCNGFSMQKRLSDNHSNMSLSIFLISGQSHIITHKSLFKCYIYRFAQNKIFKTSSERQDPTIDHHQYFLKWLSKHCITHKKLSRLEHVDTIRFTDQQTKQAMQTTLLIVNVGILYLCWSNCATKLFLKILIWSHCDKSSHQQATNQSWSHNSIREL